jgi:phosphoribosylamine-glycine ligase
MKIFLIGNGCRESALEWNFQEHGHTVYMAPGNGGSTNPLPT